MATLKTRLQTSKILQTSLLSAIVRTSIISDSPISDYFIVNKRLSQNEVDLFNNGRLFSQIASIQFNSVGLSAEFLFESISRNLLNTFKSFSDYFLVQANHDDKINSVISDNDIYPPITLKKVKISTYVTSPNMKVYKLGLYDPLLVTHETMACFASYFNNVSTYLQMQIISEYLDRIPVLFFSSKNVLFNTLGSVLSLGVQSQILKVDGSKVLEVRYDPYAPFVDWSVYKSDKDLGGNWKDASLGIFKEYTSRYYQSLIQKVSVDFDIQFIRAIKTPSLSDIKSIFLDSNKASLDLVNVGLQNFVQNLGFFNTAKFAELSKGFNTILTPFKDKQPINKSSFTITAKDELTAGLNKISGFYDEHIFLVTLHAIIRHIFGYGTEKVYIGDKLIIDNRVSDGLLYNDTALLCKEILTDALIDGMCPQSKFRVNLSTYLCIFPQYNNYKYIYGTLTDKIKPELVTGANDQSILETFYSHVIDDMCADDGKILKLLSSFYYNATGISYIYKNQVKAYLLGMQIYGSYFIRTYEYTFNLHKLSKKIFFLGVGLNNQFKLHLAKFLANIIFDKFYIQYNVYQVSCGYRTLRNLGSILASIFPGYKDLGTSPLCAYMWKISQFMNFMVNDSMAISNSLSPISDDTKVISTLLSDKLISIKYLDKRNVVTYYPRSNKPNLANFIISIYNSNVTINTTYVRSYYRLLKLLSTYKLQKAFWQTLNSKGQVLFKYLCPSVFSKNKVMDME